MINSFVHRISSILKENMVNLNDQIINSMYNQTPRSFHCSICIKKGKGNNVFNRTYLKNVYLLFPFHLWY